MAHLQFDNFIFDSERFQLKCKGELVSLRPKVLQLLNLLINNRDRVVSKAEIFSTIWSTTYARDHLLFQLISELRKSPFKADFVRTLPNQGYQWNVHTVLVSPKRFGSFKFAASVLLGLTTLGSSYFLLETNDSPEIYAMQMPALGAFSKGVIAMDSGESDQAVEWFKFALTENPDSVESSLFLAEALLQQNRSKESSEYLHRLLQNPNLDSYNKVTATNLLSRIRQKQGRFIDALKYAHQSNRSGVIAQCSVDVLSERVDSLSAELGVSLIETEPARSVLTNNEVALNENETENYQAQCEQLKLESKQTSSCSPENETQWLAYRRSMQFKIS